MEVSGHLNGQAILPPGKEPLVNIGLVGWVGPRGDLDAVAKRKNLIIISAVN
jgi:hypothetical protein